MVNKEKIGSIVLIAESNDMNKAGIVGDKAIITSTDGNFYNIKIIEGSRAGLQYCVLPLHLVFN